MRKSLLLLIVTLVLALGSNGQAAVFNVTNITDFQSSLDTAAGNSENDTIYVAAGTYNVTAMLTYYPSDENHTLTIVGAGAGETILDGDYLTQILYISTYSLADDSGAHMAIKGITFREGMGGDGGGLHFLTNTADITVEDSEFSGCSVTGTGGGVYASSILGTITFTNNTFIDNNAEGGFDGGGGVYARSFMGVIILTNNTFSSNQTGSNGGGVDAGADEGTVILTKNTFNGNYALGLGGGIGISRSQTVILMENIFINNSAAFFGGGAALSYGTVTIAKNIFSGNSADMGGGIRVYDGILTLKNNIFSDNSANEGGGAHFFSAILTLTNNTFSDNSVTDNGGGFYIASFYDDETVNIYNNIIWGNNALNNGVDLYLADDGDDNGIGAEVNLYSNDFSDLAFDDGDNLSHGVNIDQEPLLSADFHIQAGSPCIDAGDNDASELPATDFEGDPRTIDGDNDGTATVDIGADEFMSDTNSQPDIDSKGCFIATATYGSLMEKEVDHLQQFRDRFLLTNRFGRAFVSFYYKHSPSLARYIAEHAEVKLLVRISLYPAIGFCYLMIITTIAHKILTIVLLGFASVTIAVLIKKRKLYCS